MTSTNAAYILEAINVSIREARVPRIAAPLGDVLDVAQALGYFVDCVVDHDGTAVWGRTDDTPDDDDDWGLYVTD